MIVEVKDQKAVDKFLDHFDDKGLKVNNIIGYKVAGSVLDKKGTTPVSKLKKA